jgi:hypothetical protein
LEIVSNGVLGARENNRKLKTKLKKKGKEKGKG